MPEQPIGAETAEPGHSSDSNCSTGSAALVGAPRLGVALERPGDTIGPYKLLEQIGEGGFGVVWLAERREPMVQRVALKIIKPGMDSAQVIARFEAERQALAVMDHPNVAKVFDGGISATGRPYFVMEHVAGEPITTFCDRHTYTLRQRLELFIPVCEAVQHAHHKGIIHRDIKPSNILVATKDSQPVVKVIDFGVAKAISHTLTDKTIFTETGQIIGTPEYMSPEQAEMGALDIDTRTDVYSLGVVLYELLAGVLPFDQAELRSKGYAAIQQLIREQEVPRPSTRLSIIAAARATGIAAKRQAARDAIAGELRRELEWIPLKALRKDRTRRYASPTDLSRDIRNYLDGRPLEAGPESNSYRARKFIRRNFAALAASGAVLVILVLGLSTTLWQYRAARFEAKRADERAAAAALATSAAQAAEREARIQRDAADRARDEEASARRETEYNSYVANVQMAASCAELRLPDRVRQRLDACPATLRNWEWNWLNAESDSSILSISSANSVPSGAVFQADGKTIRGRLDRTAVGVWDSRTGALLTQYRVATIFPDQRVSFSRDFARAIIAPPRARRTVARENPADAPPVLWDVDAEAIITPLGEIGLGAIGRVDISEDCHRVIVWPESAAATVWSADTGQNISTLGPESEGCEETAVSSDGALAFGSAPRGLPRIWDARTGRQVCTLCIDDPGMMLLEPAFSSDGSRLAGITSFGNAVRLWDTATGDQLLQFPDAGSLLGFSPDNRLLLVAHSKGGARLIESDSGKQRAVLPVANDTIWRATFSPGSDRVITVANDHTPQVWDTRSGNLLAELRGHVGSVNSAAFSPSGELALTSSVDGSTRIWDAHRSTNGLEISWIGLGMFAAWSEDCKVFAVANPGGIQVGDGVTGALVQQFQSGMTRTLTLSPNGDRVATIDSKGAATIWDCLTGERLAEPYVFGERTTCLAFSSDGQLLATASAEGTIRVWDAWHGRSICAVQPNAGSVLALHLGQGIDSVVAVLLNSERVGTIQTWNCLGGFKSAELPYWPWSLETSSRSTIFAPLGLSSDGGRLAAGGRRGAIAVWDTDTCALVRELKGSSPPVQQVLFGPDSRRLISISRINSVPTIWDVDVGSKLIELSSGGKSTGSAAFASFSPDRKCLFVLSLGMTNRIMSFDTIPYKDRYRARREATAPSIPKALLGSGGSG